MSIFSKAGAVACMALLAAGTAQAGERYVLTASGWGKLQAAHVAAAGGTVRFAHAGAGVAVVESSNPQFLSQVLAGGAIRGGALDVEVDWTGPMRSFELEANAVNPGDDRYFATIQWAPQAVKAPQAWAAGYDGEGVRVAVIDGGIFDAHPDLGANVDSVAARSFVAPIGDPVTDPCRTAWNCDTGTFWHGTHVAGIIAAVDNTIGVVGIAPKATIVPVKALHGGSGSFGAVIQAILYAASAGNADIINMSLGAVFPRNDGAAVLTSALNRAVNTAGRLGVLVISSAGNDALDLDHLWNYIVTPAESGNGLAVSSTGPLGFAYGATNFTRFSSYSNWGTSMVTVAAPGGAVKGISQGTTAAIPDWGGNTGFTTWNTGWDVGWVDLEPGDTVCFPPGPTGAPSTARRRSPALSGRRGSSAGLRGMISFTFAPGPAWDASRRTPR